MSKDGIIFAIVLLLMFVGAFTLFYNMLNGVKQEAASVGLCPSEICVKTSVWYDGEILKTWYDDIDVATDSLIDLRKRQGDSLLTKVKNIN